MWRRYFALDDICIFFWNAPKSSIFNFGAFPVLKLITCFFLEMPHFFVFPEMPHFPIFRIRRHFGKNEEKKVRHFGKKCVINLKTGEAPKLNRFDFGAFQEKKWILSYSEERVFTNSNLKKKDCRQTPILFSGVKMTKNSLTV